MRRRTSILALLLATAGLVVAVAAQPEPVDAAGASVSVDFTVLSATVLDSSGCADNTSGITALQALPGSVTTSTSDCIVDFGATNDTASLQMYQEDGTGTALAGPGDRTATWTQLPSGTTEHLRALTALPDGRIWTSGYNGTLRYSADGGDSWADQTNPADDTLRDLFAVDGNVIWGTGWSGNVILTTDGGANWTQVGKVAPINSSDVRGGVRALDDQTAWVGGTSGRVFHTTDGGTNWTAQSIPGSTSLAWGMDLIGTDTLYLVGQNGMIARTVDSGTNWDLQQYGTGVQMYRVDALTANYAVATGDLGLVQYTDDGGTNWYTRSAPTVQALDGVVAFDEVHWLVVGFGGEIWETRNRGSSWQALDSGTTQNLRALWAPDEVSIWAVGNSGKAVRAPVTAISDYDDAANNDFATAGAGFFGACLRVAENGASTDGTTWTPEASCTPSDGVWWNAVPPTSASAGITIAKTAAPTPVGSPARARLRFAARPPSTSSPGQYRARLIVSVQAP